MKTNPNDIRFRAAFIFILERDWGGRQKELAYMAGVKPSTITGIKNGTTHGRPELQVKIAEIMGYDDFDKFIDFGKSINEPNHLRHEHHPIIVQTATEPEAEFMATISDRYRAIPLHLSGRLSAGVNGTEFDPYEVPESMVVVYKPELRGCAHHNLAALKVGGDSMEPTIIRGSIVVVDLSDKEYLSRRLFVVRSDDMIASVKRIGKWKGGFILISDNAQYGLEPTDLDWNDLCVGRVVWQWKDMREG